MDAPTFDTRALPVKGRRKRQRVNSCVLLLTTVPLLCDIHGKCEAFLTFPRIQRQQRARIGNNNGDNQIAKVGTVQPMRKPVLMPLLELRNRPSQLSTRLKGEGRAAEGKHERKSTQSKDEAERRKWGHDGISDVYEDLEILERAIRLENAELKLKRSIVKEKADFIDQSKRELIPDVLRFAVLPLLYAFGLVKLASHKNTILSTISRSTIKVMDLHFWIFVVWAPFFLNLWKRILKPPPAPLPDELQGADLDSAPLGWWGSSAFDWEDPRENCDDNVLFLTEYWTSAVNGMIYLQLLKAIASIVTPTWSGRIAEHFLKSKTTLLWLSCAQVLTRLGAATSLYQYPEKMYDLERSDITRPVGFFPTVTLKMIRAMMILAPLGFITDFSKVLLYLPSGTINVLYATIVVALYGTWARMQQTVVDRKDTLSPTRLKPAKPGAKIVYGISYALLWRKQLRNLGLGKMATTYMKKAYSSFYGIFWKTLGASLLFPLPFLGPIIHLKAFSKLLEVEYSNDMPAVSTVGEYEQAIKEQPERAYNMAWRYNIRWRPPQRLSLSKNLIYNDIIYRSLVKGTAVDILEQLDSYEFDTEAFERSLKEKPSEGSAQWKSRAMEFQAKKHQKSYESGRMEDPLGVAVWRAFGIGIGYNFEHMTELKDGEEPSPRRLQARAAKSALRRYNELTKAEREMIEHNESLDPDERDDEKVEEMKRRVDEEIKYLGNRLTELIPTTSRIDEFGELEVKKFNMKPSKTKYRKISPTEIQMLEDDPLSENTEGSLPGQTARDRSAEQKKSAENKERPHKTKETEMVEYSEEMSKAIENFDDNDGDIPDGLLDIEDV